LVVEVLLAEDIDDVDAEGGDGQSPTDHDVGDRSLEQPRRDLDEIDRRRDLPTAKDRQVGVPRIVAVETRFHRVVARLQTFLEGCDAAIDPVDLEASAGRNAPDRDE